METDHRGVIRCHAFFRTARHRWKWKGPKFIRREMKGREGIFRSGIDNKAQHARPSKSNYSVTSFGLAAATREVVTSSGGSIVSKSRLNSFKPFRSNVIRNEWLDGNCDRFLLTDGSDGGRKTVVNKLNLNYFCSSSLRPPASRINQLVLRRFLVDNFFTSFQARCWTSFGILPIIASLSPRFCPLLAQLFNIETEIDVYFPKRNNSPIKFAQASCLLAVAASTSVC